MNILKENCGISRRQFLVSNTKILGLGLMASALPGCVLLKGAVVPYIVTKTMDELYTTAQDIFGDVIFEKGSTLSDRIVNCQRYEEGLDKGVRKGFDETDANNPYCTPIIKCHRGRSRYLQLASPGNHWSVISGGHDNRSIYQIHNNWLNWLLEEDNCNLRVDGNSTFPRCGVHGCDVQVNRQMFLDVNDKSITLQFNIPPLKANDPAWDRHMNDGHSTDWLGCPDVKGDLDPCIFS